MNLDSKGNWVLLLRYEEVKAGFLALRGGHTHTSHMKGDYYYNRRCCTNFDIYHVAATMTNLAVCRALYEIWHLIVVLSEYLERQLTEIQKFIDFHGVFIRQRNIIHHSALIGHPNGAIRYMLHASRENAPQTFQQNNENTNSHSSDPWLSIYFTWAKLTMNESSMANDGSDSASRLSAVPASSFLGVFPGSLLGPS